MRSKNSPPNSSHLTALIRILQLEQKRGCDNQSVVGGLDRFLLTWWDQIVNEIMSNPNRDVKELETFVQPQGLRKILTPSYQTLNTMQRSSWVDSVLLFLNPLILLPTEVRAKRQTEVNLDINLDSSTNVIHGVGPRILTKLQSLGVHSVRDLIYHFPRRHIPMVFVRDLKPDLEQAVSGNIWEVRVIKIGSHGIQATEAIIGDETGNLRVVWFNQPFIARILHPNSLLTVTGNPRVFRGRPTLEATSYQITENSRDVYTPSNLLPVYPATEGLNQKTLQRVIREALDIGIPGLVDYLPAAIQKRRGFLSLDKAIKGYHYPIDDIGLTKSRQRLAFDEFFLTQIAVLRQKKQREGNNTSVPIPANSTMLNSFLNSLPFNLTSAQHTALGEILQDLQSTVPMSRLLQGEVGSGKTVVALTVMLMAASHNLQAAMMAPTEILAEQHFLTLSRLLSKLLIPGTETHKITFKVDSHPHTMAIGLLLGSMKAREKRSLQQDLAQGEIDLIVGTHALIQEEISIPKLALAVIDEQQRFGVMQRRALEQKGRNPHILSMSATPIPRSLALTLYGDLDVSLIDMLPQGRQQVRTRWIRPDQRGPAYKFIREQIRAGRQVFVVCPFIEESETLQTRAALREHTRLAEEIFPDLKVGLLHGRMTLAEKIQAMETFREGHLDILVSTPVIEVGVDVPNATVILIESADRFGLSELHQFRGRVGRGSYPSYCILQSDDPSNDAKERLSVLEREHNGFRVSEEDLRLRGPGELFGTRQSGLPDFKIAGPSDMDLLVQAREDASSLLEHDPYLQEALHQPLLLAVAEISKRIEAANSVS